MLHFCIRKFASSTKSFDYLPLALNTINDNNGARKTRKRIGRGQGSGKGNQSTKGHKGHRARSGGGVPPRFEGGQTPLQRRLPKWGKTRKLIIYLLNLTKFSIENELDIVNVSQLLYAIYQKRIDPNNTITIKDMYEAGLFKNSKNGIKLLGRGINELDMPINVEVSGASETVISKIKELGGQVKCVYSYNIINRTPLLIREHLHPEKFELKLRDPLPIRKSVEQLRKLEELGAEVEYNKPRWVQEQEAKEKEQEEQGKKEEKKLMEYPASREPNPDKIRRRKVRLQKTIHIKQ